MTELSTEEDDAFNALAAQLAAEGLGMTKGAARSREAVDTSIQAQKEALAVVLGRHHEQRTRAGTTLKLLGIMRDLPPDVTPTYDELRLRHVMRDNTEEIYFNLHYTQPDSSDGQPVHHNVHTPVAYRKDGELKPAEGFDEEDAALVATQIDELVGLKRDGTLPNLSEWPGDTISNPHTAITLARPDRDNK